MLVSKIEFQKKHPEFVNIFLDGKFAFSLSADQSVSLGIKKGQELDPKKLNELLDKSDFGKLFNSALNFLSFRPRSRHEVEISLKKKTVVWNRSLKIPKDYSSLIQSVIEKLVTIGQIDDEKFARWFLEQRSTFKPKGKFALTRELQNKGVADSLVKSALSGQDLPSEFELAYTAASKKAQSLTRTIVDLTTYRKAKERLQRFLGSRGFSWDTISEVVEKVLPKEYNQDRNI